MLCAVTAGVFSCAVVTWRMCDSSMHGDNTPCLSLPTRTSGPVPLGRGGMYDGRRSGPVRARLPWRRAWC